jgi:hypothetical protein
MADRQVDQIAGHDPPSLLEIGVASVGHHLAPDHIEQLVDPGVSIAAHVPFASTVKHIPQQAFGIWIHVQAIEIEIALSVSVDFRVTFVRRYKVDGDLDPDLQQLPSGSFAFGDLVVAGIVPAIKRHAEAIRITGFGEERLCTLRIASRRSIQFGDIAVGARRGDHAGGDEELTHQIMHRRLHVQGVGHRLAHPFVVERVPPLDVGRAQLGAALVEAEKESQQLRLMGDSQLRAVADLGKRPVGHGLKQIDFAVEQGGDIRGIDSRDVDDAIDIVWILRRAPPVGIADHDPTAARLERFEHEWPCAAGVARGVGLLARPHEIGGFRDSVRLCPCL